VVVLQSRLFLGMTHDIPSKNERQRCMRFFADPRQLYIPSEYSQSITSQAYSSMSNPQQLYLIGERLGRDYAFAGSGAEWVPSIIIVGVATQDIGLVGCCQARALTGIVATISCWISTVRLQVCKWKKFY